MNWPCRQARAVHGQMNPNKVVTESGALLSASCMTLPSGWEASCDEDGNVFYIDHNTKTTQWEPPDSFPLDRIANVASAGVNVSSSDRQDSSLGLDVSRSDSYEMENLRVSQARMIWKYLLAVQSDFKSKSEITETLKSRLQLANVQSESLKQVMKNASGVAKSNSLQCRNKNYDISALTKQYLESQKRVQQLRKDLSSRGFSFNLSSTSNFDNSIWHLLEENPDGLFASPEGSLEKEKGQEETPSTIHRQLSQVIAALENVRIQLAPLQPEFDHGRLSIIQEKEALMQELLNWHRDLIYERSKTEKASLEEVEEQIYSLREEITVNKQRCNFVSNRRLSLLERQKKLESRYRDLLVKLQECGAEINRFELECRSQFSEATRANDFRSSTYPVESNRRSPSASVEGSCNRQQSVDNSFRFLSDVSPLEEAPQAIGADGMKNSISMGFLMSSYQKENKSASEETKHNSALRERLEAYAKLSHSLQNNVEDSFNTQAREYHADDVEIDSSRGLYENLAYVPRVPKRQSNEEHDRMTLTSMESVNDVHYRRNADWNRIPEPPTAYHRSEDSGVASFYENICATRQSNPISTCSRGGQIVDEHSETLFSCQVLIDIKFTVSNQLHVRLEEMKEVEMPAELENIQFSVEILSLHYPHSSTGGCSSCHCSRQFSAKELDVGGSLIINEFIVFDLPRTELASKFLRIIIFCGSTSTSAAFENFLVERNLSLIQVYRNQAAVDTCTSYWYNFTAFENLETDSQNFQSKESFNWSSNDDAYENFSQMISPKAVIPTRNSSFQCNKFQPFDDNFEKAVCKTHVTSSQAMYSVKNAAIARRQVLSGATYLKPSELTKKGVEGCPEQQVVNSDEGYDERPIDCEGLGLTQSSSSENRHPNEVGLKRSHTVGQMRPYSSFNHQTYEKSQSASTKLNRSESDGAAQQYLLKPCAPVGGGGIFGRCGGMVVPSLPSHSPGGLSNRFKRNAIERIPSRAKNKEVSQRRRNGSPSIESSSPPPSASGSGSSLSPSPSIVTNLATTFRKKRTPGAAGSN